jgi:hypothetical protein
MKRIKKIFAGLALSASLALVALAIFVLIDMRINSHFTEGETTSVSNEKSSGKVLGEEGNPPSQFFTSQNFRSPQIYFGGEAITFPSGQQSVSPDILDLRSELLTTKNEQQVKFLLKWRTNKPSLSSVEYMREGQTGGKNISEDGYGYIHSAEISPLNFSTSYSYIVHVKDKWGNETQSEKLTFYTGAPNVSIFDLLGGAFKDMFGWAGNR